MDKVKACKDCKHFAPAYKGFGPFKKLDTWWSGCHRRAEIEADVITGEVGIFRAQAERTVLWGLCGPSARYWEPAS